MSEQNKKTGSSPECELFYVTQKAVIYNPADRTFLLVRAQGEFNKKYGPWEFVGGHVDIGETSFVESLKREISEDVGNIDCEIVGPISSERLVFGSKPRYASAVLCLYRSGEIVLSDEHDEFVWQSAKEISESAEYKPWVKEFVVVAQKRVEDLEAFDGWRRCMADFDNYRKRQVAERSEFVAHASLTVASDLLPVLDNFDSAISHVPEDQSDSSWVQGVGYIRKQLADVLVSSGVSEMEVSVGDVFDPICHEAVADSSGVQIQQTEEEEGQVETGGSSGKITSVLQKGYVMGKRVVRPARVTVG
ncbi:MAG: nucleotide exchange factor GrpE [Candidatus Moranbacteria bacterium]|nr:nucleotide exchange factor GrpE [Candidatus Moranbacteria bacterium]